MIGSTQQSVITVSGRLPLDDDELDDDELDEDELDDEPESDDDELDRLRQHRHGMTAAL